MKETSLLLWIPYSQRFFLDLAGISVQDLSRCLLLFYISISFVYFYFVFLYYHYYYFL